MLSNNQTPKLFAAAIIAVGLGLLVAVFHGDLERKTAADEQREAVEHVADHLIDRLTGGSAPERHWTDATGQYATDAQMVSADSQRVVLRKASGEIVKTPRAKLSAEDQNYVATQLATAGERVAVPNLGPLWYTTVIYSDQQSQQMAGWFDANYGLRTLKSETLFNALAVSDPMFRDRLRCWIGDCRAAVIVQTNKGGVVYKKTNERLPSDPEELRAEIADALRVYKESESWAADCPDCHPWRPRPEPQPQPQPNPLPAPGPNLVPDTGPSTQPAVVAPTEKSGDGWALGLGLAVGACAGLFYYLKSDAGSAFPGA